jgi:hypothetical protein
MSYDLFYDKQFVKANDNYFPIVLCGSSNLFEVGRGGRNGRRSREWWNDTYMTNGKPYVTKEELLARIDEVRNDLIKHNNERNDEYEKEGRSEWIDKYDDNRFGYFAAVAVGGSTTHTTTFSSFKSLFVTGMKKALTVEQLAENGIYLYFHPYEYGNETKKKAEELGIEILQNVTPKTTDELLAEADKWYNHYKDTGISWYITFTEHGQYFEDRIKRMRKRLFPTPKKKNPFNSITKEVDHFYTVCAPNGGYFHRVLKWGYRYSHMTIKYKFETEAQAQKFVDKYARKIELKIELKNYPTTIIK